MAEALRTMAADRGMSFESLLRVLVEALATAYKKRSGAADEVIVSIDPDTMDITFTAYDVDEDGNWVNERDDTPKKEELGRIAATTFRQVMSQRIREVERDLKFEEYADREGDLVSGFVQKTDTKYTLLNLGGIEALLPVSEQVRNEIREIREPNARLKAYIVEVRKTPKGPQVVVSRTHPGLIQRLFELEVPEIADGIVQIVACAREPGQRTKVAVWSNDRAIDPVGACVGARGSRVRNVVSELRDEKIDIIPYSEDLREFIIKAMAPAKVLDVRFIDAVDAEVIVPDFQGGLSHGRNYINSKLASRLTGVGLTIVLESQFIDGEWIANPETGEAEFHSADGTVETKSAWRQRLDAELKRERDQRQEMRDRENQVQTEGGEPATSEAPRAGGTD
jgi:N utilization substance protein A